jgi:hypothetical protein
MADYAIEHWTTDKTSLEGVASDTISVSVNNRAATRQAIANRVRQIGIGFTERSAWGALKNRRDRMVEDWDYTKIAIHHAGRSYSCGVGAEQLQNIQEKEMASPKNFDDVGYHYAIDCFGNIFEGRDIRLKGENVRLYNTGVIGIVLLEDLTTAEEEGDALSLFRQAKLRMGFGKPGSVPEVQRRALLGLVRIICEFFHIEVLGGHREFPGQLTDGKICPGNIGMALVKDLRKATQLAAPAKA